MRRWFRRAFSIAIAGFTLLVIVILVEVIAGWRCNLQGEIHSPFPQPEVRKTATAGIKDYYRPEDDTFLSYPEWYIVWSYQEKADFQQNRMPSGFPYFGAVRQYWSSYCCISRLTGGKYPFNGGEQVMLVVIGTSFSAEYILKGAYEKTVGRLTEWSSGNEPTAEDQFAYQVAREYADFVHVRPFYEFHFARQIKGLWSATRLWGAHPVRKWERKLFLAADYTIEASYCWVIEKLTHMSYGSEPSDTYAWIENASKPMLDSMPRVKLVKQVGTAFIIDAPRYQEFTAIASALAERGVRFSEIAGNSQIIVSVIVPRAWHYDGPDARQLFSSPTLTNLQTQRVVISCDVSQLHALLKALRRSGATVEHIYDY